jgi:hypothetical protein
MKIQIFTQPKFRTYAQPHIQMDEQANFRIYEILPIHLFAWLNL